MIFSLVGWFQVCCAGVGTQTVRFLVNNYDKSKRDGGETHNSWELVLQQHYLQLQLVHWDGER